MKAEFDRLFVQIYGVSKDSIDSHENFSKKYNLSFSLLADKDGSLCKAFKVIKDKSLYGKLFKGIERSTFLIDPNGIIRREWRALKVAGHAEEVLSAVKEEIR